MAIVSPCANDWAPTALSYSTVVLSGIMSVIATTGNLLVIVAVIRDPLKKLRTPFMYFLVNLAFSDLAVGCITLPVSVVTHSMEVYGTKQKVHAVIIQLSYFMSATASILSMAALCIDRYLAVKCPVKYRSHLKFRVCIGVTIVIWILALSLPFLFFVVGYMNYLMIFAHSAVVFTLLILLFTYRNIHKTLWKQNRRMVKHGNYAVRDNPQESNEKAITNVFLIILCCVFVCYLPAIVSIYILKFCPQCNCDFRHVLRDLQFLFIVSNSCVNPFICTIKLKPFKNSLFKVFRIRSPTLSSEKGSSSREMKAVVGFSNIGLENTPPQGE